MAKVVLTHNGSSFSGAEVKSGFKEVDHVFVAVESVRECVYIVDGWPGTAVGPTVPESNNTIQTVSISPVDVAETRLCDVVRYHT